MAAYHHKKPAIEQGWLRAMLFVIFYFLIILAAGMLIGWIRQSSIGSGTGTKQLAPSLFMYQGIVINALVSFALVGAFRKLIDRQSFTSLGFDFQKYRNHAAVGFFMGILLLCIGTFVLYFAKVLTWVDIDFNGRDLFIGFGLMIIVAFYEEVVFRGYILNNLLDSLNKWVALFISALLFTLAHTANPDFSPVPAVNIFLAGILLGINYIYTKNLWFAIALHFSWNFFQGPVLGYEVSGLGVQSLLQHELHGNVLLTGGRFGFEGSLVATFLYLLSIVILALLYEKKYALKIADTGFITTKSEKLT